MTIGLGRIVPTDAIARPPADFDNVIFRGFEGVHGNVVRDIMEPFL